MNYYIDAANTDTLSLQCFVCSNCVLSSFQRVRKRSSLLTLTKV